MKSNIENTAVSFEGGEGVIVTKIGEKNPNEEIEIGYVVKGVLVEKIKLYDSLKIYRLENKNGSYLGFFETSPIVSIEGRAIKTLNSSYRIEPCPDLDGLIEKCKVKVVLT